MKEVDLCLGSEAQGRSLSEEIPHPMCQSSVLGRSIAHKHKQLCPAVAWVKGGQGSNVYVQVSGTPRNNLIRVPDRGRSVSTE